MSEQMAHISGKRFRNQKEDSWSNVYMATLRVESMNHKFPVVVNRTATHVSRMLCIPVPLIAEVTGVYKRQIMFLFSLPGLGLPEDNSLSPREKAYGTSASSINSALRLRVRSLCSFIEAVQ